MKILHTGDIHVDHSLDQAMVCCNFVTDQARATQPELIVIAGDIYDKADIKLDSEACRFIFGWVKDLAQIAPVFIVKGTPTHEGNAIYPLQYVRGKFPIVVADYPGMWALSKAHTLKPVAQLGPEDCGIKAIVSAMPTPTKEMVVQAGHQIQSENDQLASWLTPIFANFDNVASQYDDVPHIHVGHYCVRGAAISETQTMTGRDIEIGRDQLLISAADLICLGHIHLHQEVYKNVFYSGSLIRKNHGEDDDKGFYIHDTSTNTSEFIVAPARRLVRIREDFTQGKDIADLKHILEKEATINNISGAFLKVELKVWLDEGSQITKDFVREILSSFAPADIQISITRQPRQNIRSKEILRAERLRDKMKLLADQNKEPITESILQKCDMLETHSADDIIKTINAEPVKTVAEPTQQMLF